MFFRKNVHFGWSLVLIKRQCAGFPAGHLFKISMNFHSHEHDERFPSYYMYYWDTYQGPPGRIQWKKIYSNMCERGTMPVKKQHMIRPHEKITKNTFSTWIRFIINLKLWIYIKELCPMSPLTGYSNQLCIFGLCEPVWQPYQVCTACTSLSIKPRRFFSKWALQILNRVAEY